MALEQLSLVCIGEKGLVRVNFQQWALKIKPLPRQSFEEMLESLLTPLIRSERE